MRRTLPTYSSRLNVVTREIQRVVVVGQDEFGIHPLHGGAGG
jgi:hypothetical protein